MCRLQICKWCSILTSGEGDTLPRSYMLFFLCSENWPFSQFKPHLLYAASPPRRGTFFKIHDLLSQENMHFYSLLQSSLARSNLTIMGPKSCKNAQIRKFYDNSPTHSVWTDNIEYLQPFPKGSWPINSCHEPLICIKV